MMADPAAREQTRASALRFPALALSRSGTKGLSHPKNFNYLQDPQRGLNAITCAKLQAAFAAIRGDRLLLRTQMSHDPAVCIEHADQSWAARFQYGTACGIGHSILSFNK
jgi:hypothetical protein